MSEIIFEVILATFAMLGAVYLSIEIRKFFMKKSGATAEIHLIFSENDDKIGLLKYVVREHGYDKRFTVKIKVPQELLENCSDAELINDIEKGIVEAE